MKKALFAYLGLWQVPIDPQRWAAPAVPGYSGQHAMNNKPYRAGFSGFNAPLST
jgi:hypothetical protein